MIAALPQGTKTSEFYPEGGQFNSDAFIQEVLERLARLKNWPVAPVNKRTVLSGFSGGGDTVSKMVKEEITKEKPKPKSKPGPGEKPTLPSQLGELILFDAIHSSGQEANIWEFLKYKLANDLAYIKEARDIIFNKSEITKPIAEKVVNKYIAQEISEKGFRFRGITSGINMYLGYYQDLERKLFGPGEEEKTKKAGKQGKEAASAEKGWFPTHKAEIIGENKEEGEQIYQALKANYQIIYAQYGKGTSPKEKHKTLMGIPGPEGRGYLEEALRPEPPAVAKTTPDSE